MTFIFFRGKTGFQNFSFIFEVDLDMHSDLDPYSTVFFQEDNRIQLKCRSITLNNQNRVLLHCSNENSSTNETFFIKSTWLDLELLSPFSIKNLKQIMLLLLVHRSFSCVFLMQKFFRIFQFVDLAIGGKNGMNSTDFSLVLDSRFDHIDLLSIDLLYRFHQLQLFHVFIPSKKNSN